MNALWSWDLNEHLTFAVRSPSPDWLAEYPGGHLGPRADLGRHTLAVPPSSGFLHLRAESLRRL